MDAIAKRLPKAFLVKLQKTFPAYWHIIVRGLCEKKPVSFRVNLIKSSKKEIVSALKMRNLKFTQLNFPENSFLFHDNKRLLQQLEIYKEGKIYIQNISSMLPPIVLGPEKHNAIVDMCAAPGSKTTQIAAMLGNQTRILAIEKIKPRFYKLLSNLKLQGADSVEAVLSDAAYYLNKKTTQKFDKILLDAPCSSEGRFNPYNPKSFAYWSERKVKEMRKKQKRLILSACNALQKSGLLLYSTCTFSPEENELVIDWLLNKIDFLKIVPIKINLANIMPALTEYQGKALNPGMKHTVRILPEGPMEGFFMCLLRRVK